MRVLFKINIKQRLNYVIKCYFALACPILQQPNLQIVNNFLLPLSDLTQLGTPYSLVAWVNSDMNPKEALLLETVGGDTDKDVNYFLKVYIYIIFKFKLEWLYVV